MSNVSKPAFLILKDETVYKGSSIGAQGIAVGEVVFNTSMVGYQEIITDPSYAGQIVTFTYPLIGNYGTCDQDNESRQPFVRGIVLRELESIPSNYASQKTLDSFLKKNNVIAMEGLDTRQLTKKIRSYGVLPGAIIAADELTEELKKETLKKINTFSDQDVIQEVSCKTSYEFAHDKTAAEPPSYHVVIMDFGVKTNILRCLAAQGFRLTVVPYNTDFAAIQKLRPDAVFLSNGPGDPKSIPCSIETIENLIGNYPIMGICLGHQLLALAMGGDTYKLKFGHRGANHPVKDLRTNRVYITSQNHGYAVKPESLDAKAIEMTHVNLNDQTNEGMRHRSLPIFSVQYHPEANPGPEDSRYLFDYFKSLIDTQID